MSRRGNRLDYSAVNGILPHLGALSLNSKLDNTIGCGPYTTDSTTKNTTGTLPYGIAIGTRTISNEGILDMVEQRKDTIKKNAQWQKYYPQTEAQKRAEGSEGYDKGLENWTSLIPKDGGIVSKDPHWLHADFEGKKHETLAIARRHFGTLLPDATTKKGDLSDGVDGVEMIQRILENDNSTVQYTCPDDQKRKNQEQLKESNLHILAYMRDRLNFLGGKLELPPGWVTFHEPSKADNAKSHWNRNNKSLSGWKDFQNKYVGPMYEKWDLKSPDGDYEVKFAKSPKDAWLIYLGYQNSGSANDNRVVIKSEKKRKIVETVESGGTRRAEERYQEARGRKSGKARASGQEPGGSGQESGGSEHEPGGSGQKSGGSGQEQQGEQDSSRKQYDDLYKLFLQSTASSSKQ